MGLMLEGSYTNMFVWIMSRLSANPYFHSLQRYFRKELLKQMSVP